MLSYFFGRVLSFLWTYRGVVGLFFATKTAVLRDLSSINKNLT